MGEATELAMLHDGLGDPVDLGVTADSLVEGIDHDDLEVLVRRVLCTRQDQRQGRIEGLRETANGARSLDGARPCPRAQRARQRAVRTGRRRVLGAAGGRGAPR